MMHIIIPVHNRIDFTLNCLESLKTQSYKNFKVILIDDGSSDNTSEIVKQKFPSTIILKGNGNLFWTKAINKGVKYAINSGADCILTLNNDTIAPEDFVEKMYAGHTKKPTSLIGALAIDIKSGKPIYGGEIIEWKTHSYHPILEKISSGISFGGLIEVSHFPGRGLLIPAIVFHNIGFYEEDKLPHYLADYDFTHRAIKQGFKVFCNYDAVLKIYPEESGDYSNRKKKSIKKYYKHLFDIKGGGNLLYFTTYAFRNCPKRYLPSFLILGYIKRIAGYLIK